MELERVRMRVGDWWEGLGSGDDRRRKLMLYGACVALPIALVLIIWNLSWMFAGPVKLEATPEVSAQNEAIRADNAGLLAMSEADLGAEITKRRAAHKEAEKIGDPTQMQAAFEAMERALDVMGDLKRKAAAGGG